MIVVKNLEGLLTHLLIEQEQLYCIAIELITACFEPNTVNNIIILEKDHYRPKCRNSKEWDGWSGKSIFVDHLIRKKDLKIILRMNFPKSLDNKLH